MTTLLDKPTVPMIDNWNRIKPTILEMAKILGVDITKSKVHVAIEMYVSRIDLPLKQVKMYIQQMLDPETEENFRFLMYGVILVSAKELTIDCIEDPLQHYDQEVIDRLNEIAGGIDFMGSVKDTIVGIMQDTLEA